MTQSGARPGGPRCIALMGPFQSGKTTLLEEILARTGAITRPGSVDAGSSVGDASAEARRLKMTVEAGVATTTFMGDSYTFIDCPGSVEFAAAARACLPAVDAAVVVCEADPKKVPQLQVILRELEELGIPRILFLNKIDKSEARVRDTVAMLQPASRTPLLLRQIPIWTRGVAVGFVDLALERAFLYREHADSTVIPLEGDNLTREKDARYNLLERLADHDDALMEQLLDDIEPPRDRVFDDLARELREGQAVPVLIGSAARGNGVLRLLKALRHEAPGPVETAARLGLTGDQTSAYVMKTVHTAHAGKLSVARVLTGKLGDSATLPGPRGDADRVSGLFRLFGANVDKRGEAVAGDTVGLGRLDHARTGDLLGAGAPTIKLMPALVEPVMALAVGAKDRKDDVKVGQALARLHDEDPSYGLDHDQSTGEIILRGQGEMHLRVALDRLAGRFGVGVATHPASIGYRETIRKGVVQRGRHKKQSGGHGQFGDVVLDISPAERGAGFSFAETISGGVVPRQYFSSVEEGAKAGLAKGPLGFPVVDVSVTLTDGSYHTVDSSDMAFQAAGRLAVVEALPNCAPVLLEPVLTVTTLAPSDATAAITGILSSRRGQMLGFDAAEGWDGWDHVQALVPEAEIGDLIIELRSATQGAGGYTARFSHLAELTGKPAEQIVAARKAAA